MAQDEPPPNADTSIIIYIIILILLIILSAFFSASETAFTSVNRARLKTHSQEGNKKADKALKLIDNFDRLLFTLLIGNNIVNITASTIGVLLFVKLLGEDIGATISTIVITVTVLIFGEIFPKTFAKEYPDGFCQAFAGVLQVFIVILFPLCAIFTGLKKLLALIFHFKGEEGVTEEDLLNIVEEAKEDGSINGSETELISSAIEFHDCEVGEILVPRVNVVAVQIDTPMEKIKKIFLKNGYSRMPVYTDTIDHIVGMVLEKDFLQAYDKGEKSIANILKNTAIATEYMKISTLLKVFQKTKVHMAIVVDEYGGTLGIVTLEDILEELVGEIWDEHDEVVEYFEKLSDTTYRVDGNADLGDFFELFNIESEEDDFDAETVGGWVTEKLGDIPKKNDAFDFEHLHIIVTKCNQRKVSELKVIIVDNKDED